MQADRGETISAGNFHGEYPAKALDYLAIGQCLAALGESLFQMCWFYMGIAQIALDPLPPSSVKLANVKKKCPKPSWQAFSKVYTPLTGNAYMETTHFKKGLPSYNQILLRQYRRNHDIQESMSWQR